MLSLPFCIWENRATNESICSIHKIRSLLNLAFSTPRDRSVLCVAMVGCCHMVLCWESGGRHLVCFQILFSFRKCCSEHSGICLGMEVLVIRYVSGMWRFSFCRCCQIVFRCGCASLYSPQQFMRNSLHPHSFPLSEMFIFSPSHSLYSFLTPCCIWRAQCTSINVPSWTSVATTNHFF